MTYTSIFKENLFANKTIIITGGGTGIGRAIAHELAALGGHVVLAARKLEALTQTQTEITQAGGKASIQVCNIRQEEQIVTLFETVLANHGSLYGLVNNAGGQFLSPAENISKNGWQAVLDTNLSGTFLMCREAYKHSMAKHGGVIINIVSEMWRGFPGMVHSGAARAGVVNLTKTLAVEWAKAGIRINAVAPGLIQSSGLLNYGEAMQPIIQKMADDIPTKRLGTESEVAAAVTFLLSPAAAYINGETLKVDGASSLWRKNWNIDSHNHFPPFDGFSK